MADLPEKRIDRAALERIMQRAAELQAAEADVGEGLAPDEVLALGREVGIPGRYLQQAMLEQATEIVAPAESGLAGQLVGPAAVSAHRVVVGDPEDAARALISWFDKHELLVVQRQQTGRVTWEPLRGMPAALRRGAAAFDSSHPKHMLSRATIVSATFTRLESSYCHVTLSAQLKQARGAAIGGGFAGAAIGASGALIAAVLSPFWVVTIPPLFVGGMIGWLALRSYRPVVERTLLGLERALDFLERGGVKPAHELPLKGSGLLGALAGEIRKALQPPPPPERPKKP
ncbi:MAG: hypothetical protein ACRENB_01390 [Gemmatimonadales bacterium]